MIFKIFALAVFLLFNSKMFAQQNYEFKVDQPKYYKFDTLLYDGIMFEFTGARIHLTKKNVFCETSFLRVIDTFKVNKGKWYIKDSHRWKFFLSDKSFDKKDFTIKWRDVYLKPVNKIIENQKIIYVFYVNVEKDFTTPLQTRLYFSMEDGVVKIDYGEFSLVRIWK